MTTFTINKDKEKEPVDRIVSVYTFWGQHDYEDDDGFPLLDVDENQDLLELEDAYAIKIKEGDNERYFVKRNKHGMLYNPIGLYSEGRQKIRHAGLPAWKFQKTNSHKVFSYYIQFLKTKNLAWLNNAEREV